MHYSLQTPLTLSHSTPTCCRPPVLKPTPPLFVCVMVGTGSSKLRVIESPSEVPSRPPSATKVKEKPSSAARPAGTSAVPPSGLTKIYGHWAFRLNSEYEDFFSVVLAKVFGRGYKCDL
ncbi:uncharacterized protein LOC127259062 isoform X2 [Andrographis paniculata]|uniref:uncharacterized protein LOC127259062 isoform X2 n=1 Tax=Andrographis paniculata TaxID=175694 RepID=UPI0021E6DE95|nr:uncharacterized protein LOC127259062 isoform X2 [Andrographis paniculata]